MSHFRLLLRSLSALDVYQINLYQYLNFMYKFKNKQTPRIFHDLIEKPVHQYSAQFLKTYFSLISYQGPKFCNDFLINKEKEIQSHLLFLSRIKSKLLDA